MEQDYEKNTGLFAVVLYGSNPPPPPPPNWPPASYKCRPLYLFAQKDESKEGVGVISLWLNLTETTAKSVGPLQYIPSAVHIIIMHALIRVKNIVLVHFLTLKRSQAQFI